MKKTLSHTFRPKSFGALIGQQDLVAKIRKQAKRMPNAWLFSGETGCGKTTIARILAVSVQCDHQTLFGNPCKECWAKRDGFNIEEVNCGGIARKVEDMTTAVSEYNYVPTHGSKYRVFILDEAQGLSAHAKTLLLKYIEDCPDTTMWILCSTDPSSFLPANRRRCIHYQVPSLNLDNVLVMTQKALAFAKSELPADPLADALNENNVTSPGVIVNAVEKYIAGSSPEEAAIELVCSVDAYAIARSMMHGDWRAVSNLLKKAKPEDALGVQSLVARYFTTVLQAEGVTSRADNISAALKDLSAVQNRTDLLQLAGVTAVLYKMCHIFR